jgi:hypothetical protein
MIYVPSAFAADAILEAADAGIGDRLHHRGHPGAGHAEGQGALQGRQPLIGPELPRHHHPRRLQDRHHAGHIHQPGASASSRAPAR